MEALLVGAIRSRLVWLGFLMVLVGAVQVATEVYQEFLTPAMQGIITSIVGSLIIYLRARTVEALADKVLPPK